MKRVATCDLHTNIDKNLVEAYSWMAIGGILFMNIIVVL